MKVTETKFTVEFTEDDVKCLVDVLHDAYKTNKAIYWDADFNTPESHRTKRLMHIALNMRDDFANLIGVRFMGEDA